MDIVHSAVDRHGKWKPLVAGRFDRQLEDIFDVQDEITEKITARVEPEAGVAERQRVVRGPRGNRYRG